MRDVLAEYSLQLSTSALIHLEHVPIWWLSDNDGERMLDVHSIRDNGIVLALWHIGVVSSS
jgi:hypothetical protein